MGYIKKKEINNLSSDECVKKNIIKNKQNNNDNKKKYTYNMLGPISKFTLAYLVVRTYQ